MIILFSKKRGRGRGGEEGARAGAWGRGWLGSEVLGLVVLGLVVAGGGGCDEIFC